MGVLENQNSIIIDRAKAAILARDFDQAIRIYRGLLNTNPENMEYLNVLGDLYVKSGDDERALDYYKEIVRLDSNNVSALNNMGAIYRRLEQYDLSISVLERAVIIDDSNVQVYYNLGFTYKLMGNYDDAIQCFNTVVESNPRDVLAFNHIGSIYAIQNKHDLAVQSYIKGLKADPNHPVLHLNLAKSYDILGDFAKAQSEYEAALKTKPGWFEAIESYSDLLLRENKSQNAGDIVRKALVINPKDAAMHAKLGDVYYNQNNYDNAENEYNSALNINPDCDKALSGLARTYEDTGRIDDALETVERLQVVAPESMDAKRQHVHILLSADKLKEAGEKITALYDANPDDVHTLNLLGQYYICTNDEKKATGCFKKIKSLKPDYTMFYKDAGKRHSQGGNYDKAEEFFQKYMDYNPESTDGIKSLAMNYEAQGKYTQALASYKQMESFDSANLGSKSGLERMNQQIIETTKKVEQGPVDEDEFADVDEDISPVKKEGFGDQFTISFINDGDDSDSVPFVKENFEGYSHEESVHTLDSGLDSLKSDQISTEKVFAEGALDEADAVPEQSKISRSLDDLIADIDFDDEGTGLEEDDTSASDFFAQNPFRSSNGLKAAPVEDDFDPEEDYAFEDEEEEEKPAPKPKKREAAPEVESTDSDLEEPAEEVEDGIFADDEDFEADEDPADLGDPEESDGFEAEDISEPEEDSALGTEEFDPAMELGEEDEMEDGLSDEPVPDETLPEEILPDENLPDDINGIDDTDINDGEEFSTEDFEEVPEEDAEDAPEFEDEPETEDGPAAEPEENQVPAAIEESTDVSADAPADAPDSSVSLFEKLRSLSDHLPDAKRQEFLESRIKVQLDYIISRLRGAEGLLALAIKLRQSMGSPEIQHEENPGNNDSSRSFRELLVQVLEYSRELAKSLPDRSSAMGLDAEIDRLLKKL
ncbi:MAG: tetratricopeptide repeat protein [Treponema sp.]|nr:tetratricopeptide repeat protein [Treponema sp.]